MADSFELKIGLKGEKEFRKALSEINQAFKVLGSEMKVASSQFDKNDNSVQALTARNQVLNKEIEAQKQKTETQQDFRYLQPLSQDRRVYPSAYPEARQYPPFCRRHCTFGTGGAACRLSALKAKHFLSICSSYISPVFFHP